MKKYEIRIEEKEFQLKSNKGIEHEYFALKEAVINDMADNGKTIFTFDIKEDAEKEFGKICDKYPPQPPLILKHVFKLAYVKYLTLSEIILDEDGDEVENNELDRYYNLCDFEEYKEYFEPEEND